MGELRKKIISSGEVVRDIGLIKFYHLLREIDTDNQIDPIINSNYIEYNPFAEGIEGEIFEYILANILFKGFINDLRVEKFDDEVYQELSDVQTVQEVVTILKEKGVTSKKIEGVEKKGANIYFPYLRNSGKFGANSQSINNFHQNLKELISLLIEDHRGEATQRQYYQYGNNCSICHDKEAPILDITSKYNVTAINKMPSKKLIYRKDSKYLYTFKGNETSSFNNYGNKDYTSSICFECEFMNLMFLSYVKIERPKYVVICSNLKHMDFIQQKIQSKQNLYKRQSFYYQVAKLGESDRIRLYQISTDANKGILMDFEKALNYQEIAMQIKVMDLIDAFKLRDGTKDVGKLKMVLKNYALNQNYESVYIWMQNNMGSSNEEEMQYNYSILLSLMEILPQGGEEMKNSKKEIETKGRTYYSFGTKFNELKSKSNLAFQLTQLLKTDNSEEIMTLLMRVYLANNKNDDESVFMPAALADDIVMTSAKERAYYVGKFISGLYTTPKKKGNEE